LDKLAWTTALKAYNIVGASSKSIIGTVIHYILNSMATKSAKDSLTEDEDGSTSSLSTLDSSPTPPNSPSFQISEDCHVKIESRSSKCRNSSSPVVRRTSLRNAQSPPTTADWADPETSKWDVRRVLMSDECLANDPLLELPSPDHSYIDNKGNLKDPHKYDLQHTERPKRSYPKTLAFNQQSTPGLELYRRYKAFLAERGSASHYISQFAKVFERPIPKLKFEKQEDAFHSRPSIKLVIPDHLKAILVDDWENVTKNQQLVPLPSAHPVNKILADYLAFEQPKRLSRSAEADILEEVVAGLKEYFERCLGRILLYR
jgi:hypothetical protein